MGDVFSHLIVSWCPAIHTFVSKFSRLRLAGSRVSYTQSQIKQSITENIDTNHFKNWLKYLLTLLVFKDVRAHCYCPSLVRTLFIWQSRATSLFSSARTESKTRQNIERMTFALTWYANIFVGSSVTRTFRQITSFSGLGCSKAG